jgi:hypothetical protein
MDWVPNRVGVLWLADIEVYEDRRAGVALRYVYPDLDEPSPPRDPSDPLAAAAERSRGPKPDFHLVKANVYLYNLGLSEVPTDLRSDGMLEIFQHAFSDIASLVERGDYQQFEVMISRMLAMPPDSQDPVWLWAAMRYRQTTKASVRSDADRISHLVVRSDGGHINKVRYTYPASLPPALAYAGFLLFLFEWKHSVDRVLAGGSPVPPEGDTADLHWTRMVAELKQVPLPHVLGFFDESVAAARQAEIVGHHFAVSGDSSERELEPDEIRAAMRHEIAHTAFTILEKDMAIELDFGGIGSFVDGRPNRSGDADE